MVVDAVDLLRKLDFTIAEGATGRSWLLRSPAGATFEVELTPAVERLNAHAVRHSRAHRGNSARPLMVGRSATDGVVENARGGHIDILTERPLRLIVHGNTYMVEPSTPKPRPRNPPKRAAWYRWAVERHLLLADSPLRQAAIAGILRTSQQTVSNAARQLGPLATDRGAGLEAVSNDQLLSHWVDEYPGPGGQEFGWYSLDPAVQQTLKAVKVAQRLDAAPLVSGDVAADRIAPWKLPTRGRVYVTSPIDLAGDGFVPAPADEATLITCVPEDPTLWYLTSALTAADGVALADTVITYWDVLTSGDIDSGEAAAQLERRIAEGNT